MNASVSSTPTNDSGYVQLTAEPFDGEGSLYDTLYTVTVTVENTGDVTAAEVAQLVSPLSFRFAPPVLANVSSNRRALSTSPGLLP